MENVCIICGCKFEVRSRYLAKKTCYKPECSSTLRSELSRKQLLKHGSPSQRPDVAKKISDKMKLAYKNGEKGYMVEVRKKLNKKWEGKGNPSWKPIGTKRLASGYIKIKVAEHIWVNEERAIAEEYLGRELKKSETVHHINGKKDDNRHDNLIVMLRKEHKAYHTFDNINKDKPDSRVKLKSNLV